MGSLLTVQPFGDGLAVLGAVRGKLDDLEAGRVGIGFGLLGADDSGHGGVGLPNPVYGQPSNTGRLCDSLSTVTIRLVASSTIKADFHT